MSKETEKRVCDCYYCDSETTKFTIKDNEDSNKYDVVVNHNLNAKTVDLNISYKDVIFFNHMYSLLKINSLDIIEKCNNIIDKFLEIDPQVRKEIIDNNDTTKFMSYLDLVNL